MGVMTIILMIVINVMWSASTVAAKYSLYITRPFSLAFFRFASATILMYVIARVLKVNLTVEKKDLRFLWAMGALGLTATYGLMYFGLGIGAPPSHAALLNACEPVIIALLSVILLRERLRAANVVAIGIGLAGVYLILQTGLTPWSQASIFAGDALVIIGLVCEAFSLLLGKQLVAKYPPICVMTYLMATGAMALIPFCAYEVWEYPPQLAMWIPISVWSLGFLIIACTVVGYTVFYTVLEKHPAGELAVFMYLQPIGGAIFGHIFFGGDITRSIVVGGALILVAIAILNRTTARPAPPPPTST